MKKRKYVLLPSIFLIPLLIIGRFNTNLSSSTLNGTVMVEAPQDEIIETPVEILWDISQGGSFIFLDESCLLDMPNGIFETIFGAIDGNKGITINLVYNNELQQHNLSVNGSSIELTGYVHGFYGLSTTPDNTEIDLIAEITQNNERYYAAFTYKDGVLEQYGIETTDKDGLNRLYLAFANLHKLDTKQNGIIFKK